MTQAVAERSLPAYWIAALAVAFAVVGAIPCGAETGGLLNIAAGVAAMTVAEAVALFASGGRPWRWAAATLLGGVVALPTAAAAGLATALLLSAGGTTTGPVGALLGLLAIAVGVVAAGGILGTIQSAVVNGRPRGRWVLATTTAAVALAPFAGLSAYGVAGSCAVVIPLPLIGGVSGAIFGAITAASLHEALRPRAV